MFIYLCLVVCISLPRALSFWTAVADDDDDVQKEDEKGEGKRTRSEENMSPSIPFERLLIDPKSSN